MNEDAVIDASALINGDGGKVVLWSDIKNHDSVTEAHGTIYAKGGANSGRGGNVETSAGQLNTDNITVDTRAADGSAGNWLLDPYNYVINATAANRIGSDLVVTNILISTNAFSGYYDGLGDCSTCGDILLNNAITYTSSFARTLTLKADSSITIAANITSTTGPLDIILWSDLQQKGGNGIGGYIYLAPGVTLSSNGGKIVLAGGLDNGANNGTSGDGIPDNFAWNAQTNDKAGVQFGPIGGSAGLSGSSINLQSNGGDIIVRGYTSKSVSRYHYAKNIQD
jgi:hypothetical protein